MDLPIGTPVEEGLKLKEIAVEKYLVALANKLFSGYVVVAIEGYSGLDEGILFMKKGAFVGAFFEFNRFSVEVFGDVALRHFLNSTKAKNGIMDICALTTQQVDLVTAFHDKLLITARVDAKNLNKLIPQKYDAELSQKLLSEVLTKEETQYDVMKKLGLAELKNG